MDTSPSSDAPTPPPRAFTQGVGTVFQVVGVLLFLTMMSVCCLSGLLDKHTVERESWQQIAWNLPAGLRLTAQQALSIAVTGGLGLGIALATAGLGLQATRRSAVRVALAATILGVLLWIIQSAFWMLVMHAWVLSLASVALTILFVALFALAIGAYREMKQDPPEPEHEVLPPDYKVPYSWYHQDPPEVRLANELEARRRRLEVEQAELKKLEEKIRRSKEDHP